MVDLWGEELMICTLCGTVHNNDDKHTCNPLDIPPKGKQKKIGDSAFSDVV